ncbi:hypothetical protein D3C79_781280 [compost metagenome]
MLWVLQGFETHIARLRGWLDLLEHLRQRESQPRNDHRPRLYATQPIDALLKLIRFDKVFQRIAPRFTHLAIDNNRPRFSLQAVTIGRRVALVGPELIEVVVVGSILERRDCLALHRHRLPARGRELFGEPGRRGTRLHIGIARDFCRAYPARQHPQGKARQGTAQQGTTGKVDAFRGDLRRLALGRPGKLDEHGRLHSTG